MTYRNWNQASFDRNSPFFAIYFGVFSKLLLWYENWVKMYGILITIAGIGLGLVLVKLYLTATTGMCTSKRNLNGKVVIVTGANVGIGYETAKGLALRGAKVVLACRDLEKGKKASDDISGEISRNGSYGSVILMELDLNSQSSIRRFCSNFMKSETRLDILVNNAGVVLTQKIINSDGCETHMAINYFGPFLLTNILLNLMKESPDGARIINVSSSGHAWFNFDSSDLDLENLNSEKVWERRRIYGRTKLYNILFTKELARRLQDQGSYNGVTVNALHPGFVKTQLVRHAKKITFYNILISGAEFLLSKTPWEGAQTTIFLAVSDEAEGLTGLYWSDCKIATPSKQARDMTFAKDLWNATVEKIKFLPGEYHL